MVQPQDPVLLQWTRSGCCWAPVCASSWARMQASEAGFTTSSCPLRVGRNPALTPGSRPGTSEPRLAVIILWSLSAPLHGCRALTSPRRAALPGPPSLHSLRLCSWATGSASASGVQVNRAGTSLMDASTRKPHGDPQPAQCPPGQWLVHSDYSPVWDFSSRDPGTHTWGAGCFPCL